MNRYVEAVLALEAVRKKREERYDRFIRRLDRRRDQLAAEVATHHGTLSGTLSGRQQAEARRILGAINASMTFKDRAE